MTDDDDVLLVNIDSELTNEWLMTDDDDVLLVNVGSELTNEWLMSDDDDVLLVNVDSELTNEWPMSDDNDVLLVNVDSELTNEWLMSDDDDVLLVNVGSGLTAAHIASLTHNSTTNIYAFGITSDRHQRNIHKLLDHLGVRCMYVMWRFGLVVTVYSSPEQVISELPGVTCHTGSHSVTFYPTQVNTPRLNPSQTGWN